MKLVHWVLLTFVLVVAADVVVVSTRYVLRYPLQQCKVSGDMKREVHEVYPLLDK